MVRMCLRSALRSDLPYCSSVCRLLLTCAENGGSFRRKPSGGGEHARSGHGPILDIHSGEARTRIMKRRCDCRCNSKIAANSERGGKIPAAYLDCLAISEGAISVLDRYGNLSKTTEIARTVVYKSRCTDRVALPPHALALCTRLAS